MVPGKPNSHIMLTYMVTLERQLPYTDLKILLCVRVYVKAIA